MVAVNKALFAIILALVASAVVARAPIQNSNLAPCPSPPYNNAIAGKVYNKLDSLHAVLATIDPLGPIRTVNYSMNNAYLRIHGSVSDTFIRDFSEYIICQLEVHIGLKNSFIMDLRLNDLRIDGIYDVNGVYALIFPIFGNGNYSMDVFNVSLQVASDVSYNIITRKAQLKNLAIDIHFDELQLYLQCILGCGEMADYVNAHISDLATELLASIWADVDPILTQHIEDAINNILEDMKIPP